MADNIKTSLVNDARIKDIVTNQTSRKIVQSLVQLAENLDIKTIADFVAAKSIFEIVYDLGIDDFQGYYFSKPISYDNIRM